MDLQHQSMRIAGKKVDAENVIEVEYPYTGEIIGTVPAGTAQNAKDAFDIAANFIPKLTRYERQKILQNTAEGTETMYLMMKNAFEVLGNRRYEWKCNNLNESSKRAALRLGFKFEGVFRQMFVFKGRNRDSAWFSIIDKEWKKLKKDYQRFLKPSNFDKNYKQLFDITAEKQ